VLKKRICEYPTAFEVDQMIQGHTQRE